MTKGVTRRSTLAALAGGVVPFLQSWYNGDRGERGPQGYSVKTLDQLKAAPVSDGALLHDRTPWEFLTGDYTGRTDVIQSDFFPLSTGAWVSQDAGKVLDAARISALAAEDGSASVGFRQVGPNSIARTVEQKLLDTVSVKDFGAVGNGIVDDTAAIQAAMDAHDCIHIPAGTYKISKLRFKRNNQVIVGDGWGNTELASTLDSDGDSVVANVTISGVSSTLLGCEVRELRISAVSLSIGIVVNWSHMQHGVLHRIFVEGGGSGCIGFALGANWTVTECTYNTLVGCYVGGVNIGYKVTDGANNNVFINCRVQPAFSGGYGFFLLARKTNASVSAVTLLGCSIEHPGRVSSGVYVGSRVDGLSIIGCRFEELATGVQVEADAVNTTLLGNYYDSVVNKVVNLSRTTVRAEQGLLEGSQRGANTLERMVVFNGNTGVVAKTQGASVVRNGVGDYSVNLAVPMSNDFPVVSVNFTTASYHRLFVVGAGGVRILLFDAANAAVDAGYVSVLVKEML